LRDIIHRLDPDLPVYDFTSFTEHLNTSIFALMPLRTGLTIAAIQGVLALALAILGLYTVVSYSVTSCTREIRLRIALGGTPSDVLRLIAREGVRLASLSVWSSRLWSVWGSPTWSSVSTRSNPSRVSAWPLC
jgi:hypothetical protein